MVTMNAREFNQSVGKAQRLADEGPVVVTRHGRPAYVLLNITEYEQLAAISAVDRGRSAWELLRPESDDPLFDEADADELDLILREIRRSTPDRPPVEF